MAVFQITITYVKNPGVHDWAFWDAHIEKALEQFFGDPAMR